MAYPKGTHVLVTSHDKHQGERGTVIEYRSPWIVVALGEDVNITIHPSCVQIITPKSKRPEQE